jgi:hypothetical protein
MAGAVAETSAPRLAGLVATVDRYFAALWIGVYLLLPVSGWASVMFTSWLDQRRDLEALRSLLATGGADAISSSGIGPAYIGAAALVHEVTRLSPEDSLIVLTRASYALSVAAGLVLVRLLVSRTAYAPPVVTLAAQLGFAALVFAAGTWYWSDVPWSHFFAMFLAVAVFVVRFAPTRPAVGYAAITGALIALLAATRSFELLALVLAWGIAAVALRALRLVPRAEGAVRRAAVGGVAFLATTAAVYLGTGKRELFFLYSGSLDQQSGNVGAAETVTTPTLSLGLVPTKLVQLFVEPCYYSLCSVSDYVGKVAGLSPQLAGDAGNYRLWRLPLAIQLPSLALLPLCVIAVAAIVIWAVRRRPVAPELSSSIRLLVELTVVSAGIVVGYAASTLTGAPHLRYGFARDFLLPALLTGVVATALGSVLLWRLLQRRRRPRLSSEIVFIGAVVAIAVIAVGFTAYARVDGIPRIESRQLGAVNYSARCSGATCDVAIAATATSGRALEIPKSSILTFGCGSDVPRFTQYAESPSSVRLAQACPDARLVKAWPTVMGLPPGTFELGAVTVENA